MVAETSVASGLRPYTTKLNRVLVATLETLRLASLDTYHGQLKCILSSERSVLA
jgi:hypothetical protein